MLSQLWESPTAIVFRAQDSARLTLRHSLLYLLLHSATLLSDPASTATILLILASTCLF